MCGEAESQCNLWPNQSVLRAERQVKNIPCGTEAFIFRRVQRTEGAL